MPRALSLALSLAILLAPVPGAVGYPVDGTEHTNITRLEAYRLAEDFLVEGGHMGKGQFFDMDEVKLRLLHRPDFRMPDRDPDFEATIKGILGRDAPAYGIAVLDLSDPDAPRYAALNGDNPQNPGSVGKIMVALAWFQALADLYPDDLEARQRLLYGTRVTANEFIRRDSHEVPFYKPGDSMVLRRPIQEGDENNLWTWFDWMLSASSNAAASTLMAHLVLLKHFGTDYPPTDARARSFFAKTSKSELARIFREAMRSPIARNGLDPAAINQGSFFTRTGKEKVPGSGGSYATANQLLQFMLQLERGAIVDAWSSIEIKRLLYLTDTRIRYASANILDDSAVYYKSGSLYSCKPEKGFTCKKYHGNKWNFMNSVATVETPKPSLHYIVAVMSNVLRKDSVETHVRLATRIHEMMLASHGGAPPMSDAIPGL